MIPIFVYLFNKKYLGEIQKNKIGESNPWSLLYWEYKPRGLLFSLYHLVFLIRRFLYAVVLVFMREVQFYQNSVLILIFVFACSYQIIFRPFRIPIYNLMMIINEWSLVLLSWMFYPFTDINISEDKAERLGWTILSIITMIIIMNMAVLWLLKIKSWCGDIKNARENHKKAKAQRLLLNTQKHLLRQRTNDSHSVRIE